MDSMGGAFGLPLTAFANVRTFKTSKSFDQKFSFRLEKLSGVWYNRDSKRGVLERMKIATWLERNTHTLRGKRIAVTGSTGGLGRELCGYLAELGASLVLLDRNGERSQKHKEELVERHPDLFVECVPLDLEDLTSAHLAVERLCALEIDMFIHNAGAYSIPRHRCASGYDNVYQINFATPYYVIRKLLPMLRRRGGKVVVVGSIAHRYSEIDALDVDFSTRRAASKVYGNAKRYLTFALHELFLGETEVRLAVTHPGIAFTNITAHYPKAIFWLIKHPMKVIFMKPRRAALSILAGVFSDTAYGEWIGPWAFDVWGLPEKKRLRTVGKDEREEIARIAETVYLQCERTVLESRLRD